MGNFFTSSQIFNGEGLDKQQFIDKFCKAMRMYLKKVIATILVRGKT